MKTTDFYSSATGTLQVKGGRDENAPKGVSLSIDDLSYIKQGSRANEGSTGTTDYNDLSNKPLINSVELKGNKTLNDLGIQPTIDSTHKVSADNIDDTTTTNKFATTAQLAQIQTNENNIVTERTNGYLQSYNLFPYLTAQGTGTIATADISLPAGEYKLTWKSDVSTGSAVMTFFSGEEQVAQNGFSNSTSRQTTTITLSTAIDKVRLYVNVTATLSDIMIFDSTLPNTTPVIPYTMSNAELTAAIQAIQALLANQ